MQKALHPNPALLIFAIFFSFWLVSMACSESIATEELIDYKVKSGDTLIKICGKHRKLTNHYSLSDLLSDIRRINKLDSNFLRIGQHLQIPVLPNAPHVKVQQPVADGAEMRGIYLTGPACGVTSVFQRVDRFIATGGNSVVFDAKDIDGGVSFFSQHQLASWGKGRSAPVISSLPEMMRRFDRRGLYVVARIALFMDAELVNQRPDLALKNAGGEPWRERGCFWVDPSNAEVRAYNLALAVELARAGVDEIQFDYVRFPTNGWQENWDIELDSSLEQVAHRRREIIGDFLAEAKKTLTEYDVKISADIFGIMAWGRMEDLALTGQHIPTIAQHVDIICPMIYPSHFGPGFEGYSRPGDEPEYFISEGTRRFTELAAGQAEIRPWLQAFPYRVSSYNGEYVETQVTAARKSGAHGWCLWNPACRYSVALTVLSDLCTEPAIITGSAALQVASVQKNSPSAAGAKPVATANASSPSMASSLVGSLLKNGDAGIQKP